MSSETILDKKVLIVLLLKNSREFHFSISILRHFCFTFHFSKRVNQIWISLFTSRSKWRRFFFHFQFSKRVKLIFISLFISRSEWKRFLFHFSLLEIPISTLAGHWLQGRSWSETKDTGVRDQWFSPMTLIKDKCLLYSCSPLIVGWYFMFGSTYHFINNALEDKRTTLWDSTW